jgi:hypothetical protein
MTLIQHTSASQSGTFRAPKYYEGHIDTQDEIYQNLRYYTYRTDKGLVVGTTASVMFSIDRPPSDVWPVIKDFNLWQNSHNHYYSGVVGNLEGQTFRSWDKPNVPGPHQYRVERVIPEYLIVISQPIPETGVGDTGLPGLGGLSPGYHVIMLNAHQGKTTVTICMQHASYASFTQDMTDEEGLRPWREMTPEWVTKFRDVFVPNLKVLVGE